jgi:hypothetical protein
VAAAALVVPALLTGVSPAQTMPAEIPAGTVVAFHVTTPLSSNQSKTGERFQFVLIAPIVAGGTIVASAGAVGEGTLILAGPAGNKGHEGDLTLRIDSVASADGGRILFDDQHFEMNGTNEKAASTLAGFIPFVGFFAQFMRGQDERITVSTPIHTSLLRPARIVSPPPFCAPPTPAPTATPSASPETTTTPSASPETTSTPNAVPAPVALATPCTPLPPCPPVTPSPAPLLTPVPLRPSVSPAFPAAATPTATPPSSAATPTPIPCISPTPYPWLTPYPLPSGGVTPAATASSSPAPAATPTGRPPIGRAV